MVNSGPELKARLAEERRLLERLRSEYAAISDSRFHALRLCWFSLKALLGLKRPGDVYAAWSPGLIGSGLATPGSTRAVVTPAGEAPKVATINESAGAVVESWRRIAQAASAADSPVVSIVIPVYNNIDVTMRCLQSIAEHWPCDLPTQVIVVDDASTDPNATTIAQVPGLDYIRNGFNSGFIRSCNRGASLARGEYVCFLNNDTIVTAGWLEELVRTVRDDATVGAVGSKLLYPDGRLQEAGGIIFRDGGGWNYGRGSDPRDPKFNYVRDVDYCSGAALLVRTELFRELGGFSDLYIPAYYEDVDLCFAIRQRGYRTLYQPLSEVIHDEGTSSGTSTESGVKRHQLLNAPKFFARWQNSLKAHHEKDERRIELAARRQQRAKTILMVDNYVPEFDKDAGSDRMFNLIKLFIAAGYNVIFLPENYYRSEPYTSILQRMGVEVVYGNENTPTQFDAVRQRMPLLDLAWVSRPEIGEKWMPVLREHPDLPVIYDTVDLHFVRIKRKLELQGNGDAAAWDAWRKERDVELAVIRAADLVIVTADGERQTLALEGVENLYIIPTMHQVMERNFAFDQTEGVLFIGGYQHPPNADAAVWLVNEIMPLVWAQESNLKLTLLGSNPTENVKALASARVIVPGYLPDVRCYFEQARVFVAPLRWGAGIKAKVGQAFGFGLPTVTTSIGAEGFGIVDGENAIVADDPAPFADAILRVYRDKALWERLSAGAVTRIEPYTPQAIERRLPDLIARATRTHSQLV